MSNTWKCFYLEKPKYDEPLIIYCKDSQVHRAWYRQANDDCPIGDHFDTHEHVVVWGTIKKEECIAWQYMSDVRKDVKDLLKQSQPALEEKRKQDIF